MPLRNPAEHENDEHDERLAKLSRMIPGVIYQYQVFPDGRACFPYASHGLSAIYGVEPKAVKEDAAAVMARVHPDDLELISNSVLRSAHDLSIWREEFRTVRPDGSISWLAGTAVPERLDDGSTLWHGYIREVTEEREVAERLRRSEALYRAIFDHANDAIFLHPFDLGGGSRFREVNARACQLLGYLRSELMAVGPGMLDDPAHMPDIPAIVARLERDGHATFETVLVTKSRKRVPVEISAHRFELEGAPYVLALARDITERREAEHLLRLNATVFQSSRDGIVITDSDNRIVDVNAAYCRITGYARDEVLGQNPSIAGSGRQPPDQYQAMWTSLEAEGYWNGELINRRKNGQDYPLSLAVTAIRDSAGAVSHYIGILRDLTETRAIEAKVERLRHFDLLTGLPNRTLFYDRLSVQILASQRKQAAFALLYVGLDRFKIINDSLGTATGDRVLVEMGRRLASLLRPTDTVSRQGGDEFALLLPNTDTEGAAHVARNLLLALAQPVLDGESPLNLTASVGVAVFPDDGSTAESLLTSADAALNRCKQRGRNTYEFFAPQLQQQARRVLDIENDLRRALSQDELELYYQPKVDLLDGQIVGAEVLLRWNHPSRGLTLPGYFIEVAEETELIVHLGHWVLERALRQQADWIRSGLEIVPVAVNVSAREFREPDLPAQVRAALKRNAVAADRLELEITERMAMAGSLRAVEVLHELKALGVAISIDDFGTGYSSLSYLKRFNVDYLKIDQSFVRSLDDDNRAIIQAILGMARGLGFSAIAEGVETFEQLDFLARAGCPQAQGFYFSRPVPADEFAERLAERRSFGDRLHAEP